MRRFTLLTDLLYILLFAVVAGWLYLHFINTPGIVTLPLPIDEDGFASPRIVTIPPPIEEYDFPEFRQLSTPPPRLRPKPPAHVTELIDSIYAQLQITHSYDPAYIKLSYPGGDVPLESGVCTDVVIRSFREQGVDLQKNIHEDMRRHFRKYPKKWGLRAPDRNIDHRRVPNMMTYFERKGVSLPISENPDDYLPGDVVAWQLNESQNHIGIVMKTRSRDEMRPMIGHNINAGVAIQDVLFDWEIVGHYRYFSKPLQQAENLKARQQ